MPKNNSIDTEQKQKQKTKQYQKIIPDNSGKYVQKSTHFAYPRKTNQVNVASKRVKNGRICFTRILFLKPFFFKLGHLPGAPRSTIP